LRARCRNGTTLIELVVALAIFVVVITGVSAALGSFFRLKSTYDQQMLVQQNFGVAVSRISQDMRAAVTHVNNVTHVSEIVQAPSINTMGDTLSIYVYDAPTSSPVPVTYHLDGNSSTGYAVYRQYGTTADQPITENMRQLVKLYFVSDGSKVVVMMVGETTYRGKPNMMSFTSLIYTRNTGYPPS